MQKFAALVLAAASLVFAQPAEDNRKTAVDGIFARYNTRTTPGCAVGVSLRGDSVLSAAYGMADLEHDVPLTPDSVFEPGSITKQFTTAAVLLLAQDGKLSIDAPVRKYIPELPDYGAPITIRHLINHTSGLRDWGAIAAIQGWPRGSRAHTHDHVLDIVSRQKALNYAPGADYSYTNTGYNLLAILVGRAAGKPLTEFTKARIFTPLGMTSSGWRDDYRRIVKNRAIAYSQTRDGYELNMPFEFVHGNGGMLTTVGDLLRWNRNFTEKKVGGQALYDAQHQRGKLNDGRTIAYAGGLMILHWRGFDEVSHSGSTAGYSAWLGRYPAQDLSVAVLCNVATNATQLGHAVADVYLPAGPAAAPQVVTMDGMYRSMRDHSVVTGKRSGKAEIEGGRMKITTEMDTVAYEKVEPWKPTREELDALRGEFVSDEAETSFTVKFDGDNFVLWQRPDNLLLLRPTYRDGFSSPLGSVRFLRDSSGKVTEMSLGDSRVWDLRFRKVK